MINLVVACLGQDIRWIDELPASCGIRLHAPLHPDATAGLHRPVQAPQPAEGNGGLAVVGAGEHGGDEVVEGPCRTGHLVAGSTGLGVNVLGEGQHPGIVPDEGHPFP